MNIPLALYVHIPWCERKCPYCDFNSHVSANIDEDAYTQDLITEIQRHGEQFPKRPLVSIFFGGGTPSLFSEHSIDKIITAAEKYLGFSSTIEITLEANPGSSEQKRFQGYRQAGVNRLSLGIQSFDDIHLKRLGRIHSSSEAHKAITAAQRANFNRINLDLMYALGEQTCAEAEQDIVTALDYGTDHLSWYQLTIEQNTEYFKRPPKQPNDLLIESMEQHLRGVLADRGLQRYEISAYCKDQQASQHNLNYWQFGDYLGIGAGAHSKITHQNTITRIANTRAPKDYLARKGSKAAKVQPVAAEDLTIEFMMNALRLQQGVPTEFYPERTFFNLDTVKTTINMLTSKGLMQPLESGRIKCTPKGYQLLDGVIESFID